MSLTLKAKVIYITADTLVDALEQAVQAVSNIASQVDQIYIEHIDDGERWAVNIVYFD